MTKVRFSLITTALGFIVLIAPAALLAFTGSKRVTSPPFDNWLEVEKTVRELIDAQGEGIEVSLWVGPPQGPAWVSINPQAHRPSASAIKTAYLVAVFDRFAEDLDAIPDGLSEALSDDHPAMEPYTRIQRTEIREALGEASIRTLGGVMMGSIPTPNHVYNAPASVITTLLGGPVSLTESIHSIDPDFSGIVARRYMLAPRHETGDNEATAASLAAVLARIASGTLPGQEAETVEAIRGAVIATDAPFGLPGRTWIKGGSLNSTPITRVKSGWWEAPGAEPVVYVVMLSLDDPEAEDRPESLEKFAISLVELLLESAHDMPQGR